MARGVKRTSAELMAEIDAKIRKKQGEIKELQSQRKEFESSHQVEIAAKIIQAANEKGISVEDILSTIKSK